MSYRVSKDENAVNNTYSFNSKEKSQVSQESRKALKTPSGDSRSAINTNNKNGMVVLDSIFQGGGWVTPLD